MALRLRLALCLRILNSLDLISEKKKHYAKVVDLVSLEAPFGPGAPDSDLTNSQINRNFENMSISVHV